MPEQPEHHPLRTGVEFGVGVFAVAVALSHARELRRAGRQHIAETRQRWGNRDEDDHGQQGE